MSRFNHSPLKSRMEAMYRIIRYLKTTPNKRIMFQKNDNFKLETYTDANWAGSMTIEDQLLGIAQFHKEI